MVGAALQRQPDALRPDVEVDVEVREELGHRVGVHVLDPGEVHGQVQVDGGDDEGWWARVVPKVEDDERAIAEIAPLFRNSLT